MPDTPQEKATAINDCNKCKYVLTCPLFKEWKDEAKCTMGVK